MDSTLPAPTQDQDEVGEKQQLQLAKRLLTCPYFNQRLKVCVHALVRAYMGLPLSVLLLTWRGGDLQGVTDIKDMVDRVKEGESRTTTYRVAGAAVVRPTVWLNPERMSAWLSENKQAKTQRGRDGEGYWTHPTQDTSPRSWHMPTGNSGTTYG